MESQAADQPVLLLLRALDQLPRADRDRILVWLLASSHPRVPTGLPAPPPELGSEAVNLWRRETAGPRGEHQLVPVRLPVDQHARLRVWCQEHGFSMATVVRGLVAQFLETHAAGDDVRDDDRDGDGDGDTGGAAGNGRDTPTAAS